MNNTCIDHNTLLQLGTISGILKDFNYINAGKSVKQCLLYVAEYIDTKKLSSLVSAYTILVTVESLLYDTELNRSRDSIRAIRIVLGKVLNE